MAEYYLGIDQGTTRTMALLLDKSWKVVAKGYRRHRQYYPKPGWVEQDAVELWKDAKQSVQEAVRKAGIRPGEIRGIGLDHQGESVVVWDRITGEPVYPAILWQDRRTSRQADELRKNYGDYIENTTGLKADAYFSGTKIQWILEQVPGMAERLRSGRVLAGTMDSWLIWNMTGRRHHVTDLSTASRTMLLNLETEQWDEGMLNLLGIPRGILPELIPSAGVYAYTDPDCFLGERIPVGAILVDQQAALFGQCCFQPGDVKATYGTGCFLLMNTGDKRVFSKGGLLPTVAWKLPDYRTTYALDGGVYTAGTAISWLQDELRLFEQPEETEQMAKSVADTGGVFFVPAFSGLGAPHWDQYARGTLVGLTGGTQKEHIVRAALESIAYQVSENIQVMRQDLQREIQVIRADGGMSGNSFFMQFQADILDIAVDVPVIRETTALGAAYMAAVGLGTFTRREEIEKRWKRYRRYEPQMSRQNREALLGRWKQAVDRAKGWERS